MDGELAAWALIVLIALMHVRIPPEDLAKFSRWWNA